MKNKSVLMYRILNGYTSLSLREWFTIFGTLQGNYHLRNSHTDLALPNLKRELFLKKCFKYSGAKLWNSLSQVSKRAEPECAFRINIS